MSQQAVTLPLSSDKVSITQEFLEIFPQRLRFVAIDAGAGQTHFQDAGRAAIVAADTLFDIGFQLREAFRGNEIGLSLRAMVFKSCVVFSRVETNSSRASSPSPRITLALQDELNRYENLFRDVWSRSLGELSR